MTKPGRARTRARAAIVLAVMTAVGVAVVSPTGIGAHAAAAEKRATAQVVPVAGSSDLLVFATKREASRLYNDPTTTGASLHVLTRTGHQRVLLASGARYGTDVSVAGWVVEVYDGSDRVVQWWDLSSHTHGSATLDRPEQFVGASPTGFVYTLQEGDAHLLEQSFTGTTTDLGDPLDPDQVYRVVTGTNGLVASQSDSDVGNRQVVAMSWAHLGHFRQLHKLRNNGDLCSGLGPRYVACTGELIPLSGSKPVLSPAANSCFGLTSEFQDSAVWMCGGGRLHQLTAGGRLHTASRHYGPNLVVSALGRLFVSSPTASLLWSLTSLNSTPHEVWKAS